MKYIRFFLIESSLILFISCNQNKVDGERTQDGLSFPNQTYLDNMGEDECFPTIENDGQGFDAISHNIVYPELLDTLLLRHYADLLAQFYNIVLAFNTMVYDVGTAERYIRELEFRLEQADALDSIDLSGIHISEIKDLIRIICQKGASAIRRGEKPNDQDVPEIKQLYDAFKKFSDPIQRICSSYNNIQHCSQ